MKIDLKDVNTSVKKQSKQQTTSVLKLVGKLKLPFNKPKGPARDTEGKFTSGSGGLKAIKKLNNKRALSVIVVVALIGGLFVFRSFAAGTNGPFVTEMYQRCYNVMKTSGSDYTYWLNRLDKGEGRNSVWASFVAATGKPCSYPYPPTSASSTPSPEPSRPPGTQAATMTAAQVTALYKELFNRDPSTSEVNFWIEKSKTWTAAQVKAHLQASDEYFRKNTSAKVQEAEAWKQLTDAHVINAKNYNAETYKLSTQTVLSRENLATIATREKAVRDSISQVAGGLSTVKTSYQKATASNAPEALTFKTVIDSLTASTSSLNGYLKNISADYTRAQKTYEANLKFFQQVGDRQRQEQDCRNRGGTPTWTGGCNMPAPQPATNSGGGSSGSYRDTPCNRAPSSNISACQRFLGGIPVDGSWGRLTEAAFHARFGEGSGWSQSTGGTGGGGSGGATGSQQCAANEVRRGGECRPNPTGPDRSYAQEVKRCTGGGIYDEKKNQTGRRKKFRFLGWMGAASGYKWQVQYTTWTWDMSRNKCKESVGDWVWET